MHKVSDEFEFRPDRIIHFGITCPWASLKKAIFDLVRSIAPSVLIGSSSSLEVTRTDIKSGISLNLGQFGIFVLELLALECHKSPYSTLSDR